MQIRFTGPSGLDPADHLTQLQDALQPTVGLLRALASGQASRIKERTKHGYDADGNNFAPYSPKYAERKQKAGGNGIVNLFSTYDHQHMMDSLGIQINGQDYLESSPATEDHEQATKFDLGFFDSEEIETRARVHNEGSSRRNIPQRRFLAMSDSDIADATNEAGKAIELRLQRLL